MKSNLKYNSFFIKYGINIILLIIITSCSSPGSLGSGAKRQINCPLYMVENSINQLLNTESFKILDNDSLNANMWLIEGEDSFLNYHCISIKKKIYAFTLSENEEQSTIISICSQYDYQIRKWIMAKNFKQKDIDTANSSLDYLLKYIQNCE